MCISEIMVVPFENMVLSDDYLVTHNNVTELFGSTLTKLVFFIFCRIVSRVSRKETTLTKSLVLLCVPVVSLICSLMLMSLNDYYDDNKFYLVVVVFAVSAMIINTAVFYVHESFLKNAAETEKLKLSEQKNILDYEHYKILQENYNNHKILVHNIKHNMKMIAAMAEKEDIDSLKEYVRAVQDQEHDLIGRFYTGNKIADVIIIRESEKCKKSGIEFNFVSNEISFDFMNEADICCILSNLFDNAHEAAEKSKDKIIEAEFYYNGNRSMLFIEISNSCDTAPVIKNNRLQTDKKDKENHGIGMYSVEKTVSKYGGFLSYEYNKSEHTFKTVAAFNTAEKAVTC